MRKVLSLLPSLTAALFAQSASSDPLLVRGRDRILQTIERQVRYTCVQTVDRSEFHPIRPPAREIGCDQLQADRRKGDSPVARVRADRLRLEVEITENGQEVFSWPGAGRIASEQIRDFSREGLSGTGTFGRFLIDVFNNRGVRFWPLNVVGGDARDRQYRYVVPLGSSHYRVAAGESTRVVPYEGRFWLDSENGELRRLLVQTGELSRSTGVCEGSTLIDYAPTKIGSGQYLLPSKSVLHVVRRDAVELENVTTYSACQEFHGESTVRFGEVVEAKPEGPQSLAASEKAPAAGKAASFPAGVPIAISFPLTTDTSTAAAGDLVPAVVKHGAGTFRKRLLPETGAPARCRLTGLEQKFGQLSGFAISIACEAVQLNGVWIPFAATRDEPADLAEAKEFILRTGFGIRTRREARRSGARGGTFVFRTSEGNYTIPPFSSPWISVIPQKP